jgi:4,5-dihydroxyphthalate decarboxylase
MIPLHLSLACTVTDRTRPILEATVAIDGCHVDPVTGEPEDLFARALRHAEFDVTELSLSSYLIVTGRDTSAYVAVPAFPSRAFRHSAVYVRTDRGIDRPEDLIGTTIGVPEYQQTVGLWIRGILTDRYGVAASAIRWRSGGLERPGAGERIPVQVRDGIDVRPIDPDATLSDMLAVGDLDGIVSPRPPSCFTAGHPRVRRLWPDHRAEERRFFLETRLFPIMHVVAVKRSLVERHPWLPANVFRAFAEAKRRAIDDLEQTNFLRVTLPWIDLDEVRSLMGDDYWPYGVAANRAELASAARWSYEEGLSPVLLAPEDLFDRSSTEVPG